MNIRRLTIAVGEASGHAPHHIREYFTEAALGTAAEGAELQFIREELSGRCAGCGTVFERGTRLLLVPAAAASN